MRIKLRPKTKFNLEILSRRRPHLRNNKCSHFETIKLSSLKTALNILDFLYSERVCCGMTAIDMFSVSLFSRSSFAVIDNIEFGRR